MQRVMEGFQELIAPYGFTDLDADSSVCYALTPNFMIAYFNKAWSEFAEQNGGEPTISKMWGVGSSFLESLPHSLRGYYKKHYSRCMESGHVWECDYECSSDDTFRRFHQTVYPLAGKGLLIHNALRLEEDYPSSGKSKEDICINSYLDSNRLISQCSHCRKFRNRSFNRWDWIPEWVKTAPMSVSHSLCKNCLEFYYPDLDQIE